MGDITPYNILVENNRMLKALVSGNNNGSVSKDKILGVVSKYPVPDVTPKQLVIMFNRKYDLDYICAVTGMKAEEVIKKRDAYLQKHM